MSPDRIGNSNMWSVRENEYFVDEITQIKVGGPLIVRVSETGIGLLAVQGTNKKYEVPGDKMEDFPAVVMKTNS